MLIIDFCRNILLKQYSFSLANILTIVIIWFFSYLVIFRRIKKNQEKRITEKINHEYDKTLNEFVAGISDGIRNPLVVIKGFIQLEQMKRDSTLKDSTGLIIHEIKQIEDLIENLYKLTNNLVLNHSVFNINALFREIRNLTVIEFKEDAQRILFDFPPCEILMKGDRVLIQEMILMLIRNSIEAIPKDGVVHVGLSSGEKWIQIYLNDNGPGIPAHIHDRIGRPFNTTKGTRPGLGLAICKKIINSHQGFLKVIDNDLGGTTIEIALPVEPKK